MRADINSAEAKTSCNRCLCKLYAIYKKMEIILISYGFMFIAMWVNENPLNGPLPIARHIMPYKTNSPQ